MVTGGKKGRGGRGGGEREGRWRERVEGKELRSPVLDSRVRSREQE